MQPQRVGGREVARHHQQDLPRRQKRHDAPQYVRVIPCLRAQEHDVLGPDVGHVARQVRDHAVGLFAKIMDAHPAAGAQMRKVVIMQTV